jgi:methionine-rich copper-binding protein CopC
MMLRRRILASVALTLGGAVMAHAYLERVTPAAGPAHVGPPDAIALHYSAPIEAGFSAFDLYLVAVDAEALPSDPAAPTEAEWGRLTATATQFAARARGDTAVADAARVPLLPTATRGAVRDVRLEPTEPLAPGLYVLDIAALATDGHVMPDQHVFLVVAGETPPPWR